MIPLLVVLAGVLAPSAAFAWGPLTHIYLANEIYSYAPLIPAGVLSLIRRYRQDFLYGSVMADMILGKKYLPEDRSSHNWDVAWRLFGHARTGPEKAFVYGYLCHLAADTVAHETLTEEKMNVAHTWIELKADSLIDKVHWLQAVAISRVVQRRNDLFLESSLGSFIFSFKTNRRIYKGIVVLSLLNKRRRRGVDRERIQRLHDSSIGRMLDLLRNMKRSQVLDKSPL